MVDDATRQYLARLSPAERLQLQALANKQNQTLETMADIMRRQQEAQQSIINRMR